MTEQITFQIGDLSRLLRRDFDGRARAIGVTRPQWKTLLTLARHEGANQGRLAELLDVEPISLCRMVDRLEEAGLVERRRDPADRRAWRIYLTKAAGPILVDLRKLGDSLIEDALAGLSVSEREALGDMLDRIRSNLTVNQREQATANG